MATQGKSLTDRLAAMTSGFIGKYILGDKNPEAHSSVATTTGGTYRNFWTVSYDGEKNLGEMGPIKDYIPNYYALSMRSWQAMMESEMAVTIVNKKILWVISKGLKLQSNPVKEVLESEGIKINTEEFNRIAEARFAVWAKSRKSSYTGMSNLHDIAKTAYKNAKVGGDVLVVLRYENGIVNVELIDGAQIKSPSYGDDYRPYILENGNTIRNGVEISPRGEHIAFYVCKPDLTFERIKAKHEGIGFTTAFLVYGHKHRLQHHRGIPLIAVILESIKKLERYKEATVGSAEERAKIAYQIVHGKVSDGQNPLSTSMAKAFNAGAQVGADQLPVDVAGNQLANTVAATTNKMTFNMPIDSELKSLEAKNELFFKEFYTTNADAICATFGIPPNVAFSIYNDSFSASRAATKDWEHTITVDREDITFQLYQPIYNFWLLMEILTNKIPSLGYLNAFASKNWMALEAFQNARFTGSMFPHIDPLKEVQAERLKLGASGTAIPLTTVEAATESLNGGDSGANMEQYAAELEKANTLGIKTPVTTAVSNSEKEEKEKE